MAHSRSPTQRHRAIRQAIQGVGFPLARQAARNLPLSPHHRGENERGRRFLEVEFAMKDPESLAKLYSGPKEGLTEALRKSLKTSTSSAAEKEDSAIAGCASSVPGRQAPKKGETSPSPAEIKTGKPKGTVTRSNPSFFMVQESVFDAHDLGLRTLAELEGRPFHPTDRKTAQNRRDVAAAIRQVGAETARLAARNLVLSADHRSDEILYMDISLALGEPESFTALFEGPDAELENTLRESLKEQIDEADEGRGTQGPTLFRDPRQGLAGVNQTTTSCPSGHGALELRP